MEHNTRVSGWMVKLADKASFSILMVTFMRETGLTTKLTASEHTLMSKELSMRDSGRMTNNMVKELKSGKRDPDTMVCIIWGRKKDSENTLGLMGQSTKENG
jgi:hypothetical protein